jgi:hypothetical protein
MGLVKKSQRGVESWQEADFRALEDYRTRKIEKD